MVALIKDHVNQIQKFQEFNLFKMHEKQYKQVVGRKWYVSSLLFFKSYFLEVILNVMYANPPSNNKLATE